MSWFSKDEKKLDNGYRVGVPARIEISNGTLKIITWRGVEETHKIVDGAHKVVINDLLLPLIMT